MKSATIRLVGTAVGEWAREQWGDRPDAAFGAFRGRTAPKVGDHLVVNMLNTPLEAVAPLVGLPSLAWVSEESAVEFQLMGPIVDEVDDGPGTIAALALEHVNEQTNGLVNRCHTAEVHTEDQGRR